MKTVLVIEDNREMAENISAILRLAHYNVLVALEGKTGVQMAQQQQPDLVLCDIMIPDLDGYGILQILNSDPDTSHIPFIFLTAKVEKEDFRKGMNLGAEDYLTKPFDGSDLLRVVEMRLKKSELLKQYFNNDTSGINSFFTKAKELKELKNISENRATRSIKKKEFLFMEGQTANDLYFIQRGAIKIYKTNRDGKELITGIYKEGDFVGYLSLFEEDSVYKETAIAMQESQIMLIPKQDFLSLMYSNQEIAMKFIKIISNNLIETENRLVHIAYQTVRQRVAGGLLKLQESLPIESEGIINIQRRDFSSIVGTATETLNRMLADFKNEALIDLNNEGIKILNSSKLKRIAR